MVITFEGMFPYSYYDTIFPDEFTPPMVFYDQIQDHLNFIL